MADARRPRPPEEPLSFEEAFNRLEETVRALEAGGLPLAEMLRLYEQGMRFAHRCEELLTQADLRITYLQTSYGQQMRLPPLPGEEGPGGDEAEGEKG